MEVHSSVSAVVLIAVFALGSGLAQGLTVSAIVGVDVADVVHQVISGIQTSIGSVFAHVSGVLDTFDVEVDPYGDPCNPPPGEPNPCTGG
ncbi:MAG: hypothetical protein ABIH41_06235 [Nanoarchaeota archaeon]